MPVSASDFRVFADSIDRSTEIGHRNAVSRLYYSFYLEINKIIPIAAGCENSGVHERLIITLKKTPASDKNFMLNRRIATVLTNAKTFRVKADYMIDEELDKLAFDIVQNAIDKLIPDIRQAYIDL